MRITIESTNKLVELTSEAGTITMPARPMTNDGALTARANRGDNCPYCGPVCYGGAAHNARAEDGAYYVPPGSNVAQEVERRPPEIEPRCPECDACARHAYSDATTPGFFYDKCPKHRAKESSNG